MEDSEALDEWNAPSPPAIIVTADKLLIPDRLIKMDSKSIELIHMSLPFLNDNAFDYHLRRTEKLKVDPQIYLNRFTCILQPKDEADENSRNSRRRDQMKLIHLIQCGNELEDDMKPFNDLVSTLSCLDKCSKLTERDLSRYSDISELLKSDLLGWKRNAGDEDRVQSSCRKSFRLNRIGMEDTHDLELRLKFSRLLDITDAALNKEVVDTAQDGGGGDDDNPFL